MSDSGEHSHGNIGRYYTIFGALIAATVITVALSGPYTDFGRTGNIVVGLIIATFKASLVALYFMHLKYEANWKYVLLVPPSVLFVFMVVVMHPDIAYKETHATPYHPPHAASHEGEDDAHGDDTSHGEAVTPPADDAEAEDH